VADASDVWLIQSLYGLISSMSMDKASRQAARATGVLRDLKCASVSIPPPLYRTTYQCMYLESMPANRDMCNGEAPRERCWWADPDRQEGALECKGPGFHVSGTSRQVME
jgi:hypothetical protein